MIHARWDSSNGTMCAGVNWGRYGESHNEGVKRDSEYDHIDLIWISEMSEMAWGPWHQASLLFVRDCLTEYCLSQLLSKARQGMQAYRCDSVVILIEYGKLSNDTRVWKAFPIVIAWNKGLLHANLSPSPPSAFDKKLEVVDETEYLLWDPC